MLPPKSVRIGPVSTVFFSSVTVLTVESLAQFPGRSLGYGTLPAALRRQIAEDVPRWSSFIRQEADRFGYPYIDMINDSPQRLTEAERLLTTPA